MDIVAGSLARALVGGCRIRAFCTPQILQLGLVRLRFLLVYLLQEREFFLQGDGFEVQRLQLAISVIRRHIPRLAALQYPVHFALDFLQSGDDFLILGKQPVSIEQVL